MGKERRPQSFLLVTLFVSSHIIMRIMITDYCNSIWRIQSKQTHRAANFLMQLFQHTLIHFFSLLWVHVCLLKFSYFPLKQQNDMESCCEVLIESVLQRCFQDNKERTLWRDRFEWEVKKREVSPHTPQIIYNELVCQYFGSSHDIDHWIRAQGFCYLFLHQTLRGMYKCRIRILTALV